ncbi:EAL domain-containing protein [Maribrevibacterium harenarium]|uniref:EAL domain-containing protein n=1 Tax=Maribrevibacterium harenarium TaxID=2589817 RepID=A0A501WEW4_9GAMM|nr:EAL domain-containing protein [Maribrevibacterium harenarium]TPE47342.1 EAL domain-containing protein [Maribrevibacterium harenarium]
MLLKFLARFFLVGTESEDSSSLALFKVSALRIILTCCLAVCLGYTFNGMFNDISSHFVAYGIFFSAALGSLLYFSRSHTQPVAAITLGLFGAFGVLLAYGSDDLNAVKLGLISLYSLPLLARILFSFRLAAIISIANIASFALAMYESYHFTNPDTELFGGVYFQTLSFILLNFALPFSVSRVFHTLQESLEKQQDLNERLNHHSELYEEIFEHTGTPTLLCSSKGEILKANQQAVELLQPLRNQAIESSTINDWLSPITDAKSRYFWQKNVSECSLRIDRKVHIEVHRSSLTNHGHYVLHLQDVSHLKALAEELETTQQTNSQLAHFDSLTRLPNHQNFCRQVNHRIKNVAQYYTGAMFIIRISQFKLLNKQYGRDHANRVILSFSRSLQNKLSAQTITGRLRGVKFACFLPLGQTYLIQRNLSALIKSVLPTSIEIEGDQLNMDYQIGVAYYRNEGESAEELLERCEMALEYSTSADRISYYNHNLESKLIQNHRLGLQLAEAVKNKEIQIWLQPQVHPSGEVRSFEALARWQLADGTYVSPMIFIKLAEELGLLPKLAEGLLRELVSVLKGWHQEHISIPIAFNLAGQELMNDVFFALLMSLTSDHPWLSELLELEITETSPDMTQPLIHKRLRTLSQYGYTIAIDDFGTGQASMGQLIDIPANILKIDRRFVAPLPADQRHLDIVKSTVQLAKSLNMKVIAEGIENREQANLLISLGCDTLQGYYFGKPAPISEWIENDNAKAKSLRMVY